MYGSPTCPAVPPVRSVLNRAQVPFEYVNILEDAVGSARVKEINDGYASVPTLVFPDGSTLTEPSTAVLRQKLESFGYVVKKPTLWQALTDNPFYSIMAAVLLLFALVDQNWVFAGLGLGLLLYTLISSQR